MSPEELLKYLEERYQLLPSSIPTAIFQYSSLHAYRFNIKPPEELSDSEKESYVMEVVIPVQLR